MASVEMAAIGVITSAAVRNAGSSSTDMAKLALMVLALDSYQRRAFDETT